jgi:hypothetical protein
MTISRSFNSVIFLGNEVYKSSEQTAKIVGEYEHYYAVSDAMRRYLVQPYNLLFEGSSAGYTTQKHANENAGQLYARQQLNGMDVQKILYAVDRFRASAKTLKLDKKESRKIIDLYTIEKASSRTEELRELLPKMADLVDSLSLLNRLEVAITTYSYNLEVLAMESHGDLCLSNILLCFDGKVRFIDPRGVESIWLDEYYDIAKLSQSFLGEYDYIINDLPVIPKPYIKDMFIGYTARAGMSHQLLIAYEASLFISMCPLHADRPDHVKAFLHKADSLLKEIGQH